MSEEISPGAVLGGRYRVDSEVVSTAEGDLVFEGKDQVLNRPVSILLAAPQNATRVAVSAREIAMGARPSPVQVLDLGMSQSSTYLVANTVDAADLLDLVVEPDAPYIEPFQTDTLGQEIFGEARAHEPHVYDDDADYYEELAQEQTRKPLFGAFADRLRNRLRPGTDEDGAETGAQEYDDADGYDDESAQGAETETRGAGAAAAAGAAGAGNEASQRGARDQDWTDETPMAASAAAARAHGDEDNSTAPHGEGRHWRDGAADDRAADDEGRDESGYDDERTQAQDIVAPAVLPPAEPPARDGGRPTPRSDDDVARDAIQRNGQSRPASRFPIRSEAGAAARGGQGASGAGTRDDESNPFDEAIRPRGAAGRGASGRGAGGSTEAQSGRNGRAAAGAAAGVAGASAAAGRGGSGAGTGGGYAGSHGRPANGDDADDSPRGGEDPARRKLTRLLVGAALVVVLVVAVVFAVQTLLRPSSTTPEAADSPTAEQSQPSGSGASESASADGVKPVIESIARITPGAQTLNAETDSTLRRAIDGSEATSYRTYTFSSPKFGGYAKSMTLQVELQKASDISSVDLTGLNGTGGSFEVLVGDSSKVGDAREIYSGSFSGPSLKAPAGAGGETVKGKYVFIRITELPRLATNTSGDRPYGFQVAEIKVS